MAGAGLVGVGVGLTTTGVDDTMWVEEEGLREEDLCLQRFEFWRFLRGTRGTSRGAGRATRAAMALWWRTTWGVARALEAAKRERRKTRELKRAIGDSKEGRGRI
jgi:hypothetical protein